MLKGQKKKRFYKFRQPLRDVWAIAAFSLSCLGKLSAIKLNWLNIYAGMLSVSCIVSLLLWVGYIAFFFHWTNATYEVVRETDNFSKASSHQNCHTVS